MCDRFYEHDLSETHRIKIIMMFFITIVVNRPNQQGAAQDSTVQQCIKNTFGPKALNITKCQNVTHNDRHRTLGCDAVSNN